MKDKRESSNAGKTTRNKLIIIVTYIFSRRICVLSSRLVFCMTACIILLENGQMKYITNIHIYIYIFIICYVRNVLPLWFFLFYHGSYLNSMTKGALCNQYEHMWNFQVALPTNDPVLFKYVHVIDVKCFLLLCHVLVSLIYIALRHEWMEKIMPSFCKTF